MILDLLLSESELCLFVEVSHRAWPQVCLSNDRVLQLTLPVLTMFAFVSMLSFMIVKLRLVFENTNEAHFVSFLKVKLSAFVLTDFFQAWQAKLKKNLLL